jgi:hypothetical protein
MMGKNMDHLALSRSMVDYCPMDDDGNDNAGSVVDSLEELRDYVSFASLHGFIPALDRIIQMSSSSSSSLLYTTNQKENKNEFTRKEYSTVASIIEDANHLEHFHLYSKKEDHHHHHQQQQSNENHVLEWHTDGGLFLAFIPGTSCSPHTIKNDSNDNNDSNEDQTDMVLDPSFRIVLEENNQPHKMNVSFPKLNNNEINVAIMLGAGAQHWLNTPKSLPLHATQHAITMNSGDVRAWYGMMHLVPSNAVIQDKPTPRTFAEMKQASVHSLSSTFSSRNANVSNGPESSIAIGCGNYEEEEEKGDDHHHPDQYLSIETYRHHKRRRLQHVGGHEDCAGSSNYFCWLSCIGTPNSGLSFDEHLDKDESLYCLDPSILDSTGNLTLAVQGCSDEVYGTAGGVMDEACQNYWHPTVDGVQSYLTPDVVQDEGRVKYCYGATAMYMQGFEWEGTTCVAILFSSWVVSSRLALFLACIAVLLLAVFTESLTRYRRPILARVSHQRWKVTASAVLYAFQVTMGYAVMLIIMTYSGPLVLSTILGLGIGHGIGNWNATSSEEIIIEGSTPCCAYLEDTNVGEETDNSDNEKFDKSISV